MAFILRLLIILLGIILCPIAIATAKNGKFRKPFYVWDNEEDGYNGLKKGGDTFWVRYLKERGKTPNWWTTYTWCALRNPAYNLRFWKYTSDNASGLTGIKFSGNTYHKGYKWAFERGKRQTIWYKFSGKTTNGNRRHAFFYQRPLGSKKSLTVLIGWKFYPAYYMDDYQKEKIKREGFPRYKTRIVPVFSIKIKSE